MTPRVAAIWRHPIKAHGRERLGETTLVTGQTLPGDRIWAVTHEASKAEPGEWSRCVNFTRAAGSPALMAITSESLPDGRITLRHPERPDLTFDPANEGACFIDWVTPLMPEGRAAPVNLIPAPADRGLTDSRMPSLSIFGMASHEAVGTHLGQDLSTERWRGNLILDGLSAWSEFDWVGRDIAIGEAVLSVRQRIERCLATASNPETGHRDADTLGALDAILGARDFGIYAEVTGGGRVAEGDKVRVIQ